MDDLENGMYRGAAVVIAELVRTHDQPTLAAEVAGTWGSIADFKRAQVDEYDMAVLRKLARTEPRWRKHP